MLIVGVVLAAGIIATTMVARQSAGRDADTPGAAASGSDAGDPQPGTPSAFDESGTRVHVDQASPPKGPSAQPRSNPSRPSIVAAAPAPRMDPPKSRAPAAQRESARRPPAPSSQVPADQPSESRAAPAEGEPVPASPGTLAAPSEPAPPAVSQAAPAPAAEPVLTPPVAVSVVPPRHPFPYQMVVEAPGVSATARLQPVEARVRLRILVRVDGTVGTVEIAVASSRPDLDAAAVDAAKGWRFLPARRDGHPVESIALVWVAFTAGP
jgi:protein TonB